MSHSGQLAADEAAHAAALLVQTAPSIRLNQPVTVANLPAANKIPSGCRAIVSDATVSTNYTVVAGGGAITVPVFSDGANWRIG